MTARANKMFIVTLRIIDNYRIAREAARLRRLAVALSTSSRSSCATPLRWQQSVCQPIEISERKAGVQVRSVLEATAITEFVEPPESLDYMEGMFHAGSRGGSLLIYSTLILGQRSSSRPATDSVTMRLVPVGLVAKHFVLRAVQPFRHPSTVMHVRCARAQAVHDPASIRADVRHHPAMPVLSILRRAHLRISRVLLILCRWGRGNDGRRHNSAALEPQPLLLEQAANLGEYLLRQWMPLEKMAKVQYRRFIQYVMSKQFDSHKSAHRLDVVEGILGLRIRQVELALHEVDTQHLLHRLRQRPVLRLRVVRLNQRQQSVPGNHRVHFHPKLLAACHLSLLFPRDRGKRRLLHRSNSSTASAHCTHYRSFRNTCAELPQVFK